MSTVDATAETLRSTFERVRFPLDADTKASIREKVFVHVDTLVDASQPREHVFLHASCIAWNILASPERSATAGDGEIQAVGALMTQLVSWSVERYLQREAEDSEQIVRTPRVGHLVKTRQHTEQLPAP